MVSIPFREDLHSDRTTGLISMFVVCLRFHPFQGRPSFGLTRVTDGKGVVELMFPSLSGKTFIRTIYQRFQGIRNIADVSIPFREDLHSDCDFFNPSTGCCHPVSIPFREDLHSDIQRRWSFPGVTGSRFHPFQGRPSFGPRTPTQSSC